MSLKNSVTGRALFHNVDRGMGRRDGENTITMAVFSEHRAEAEPLAGVLPALCMQRLAPTTKEWFDGGAVRRCKGVKFAKKGNSFITPEDINMKMVTKDKMGGDHLLEAFEFDVAAELMEETERDHHLAGRPDDDSLYTMGLGRRDKHDSDSEEEDTEDDYDGKTDTTSTLTPAEPDTKLLEELARVKALLNRHGIQDSEKGTEEQSNVGEDQEEEHGGEGGDDDSFERWEAGASGVSDSVTDTQMADTNPPGARSKGAGKGSV